MACCYGCSGTFSIETCSSYCLALVNISIPNVGTMSVVIHHLTSLERLEGFNGRNSELAAFILQVGARFDIISRPCQCCVIILY
jgi:hypothetical protein